MLLGDTGKEMSPLTQFNLFWAARSDHLDHKVRPALLEGRHVISDRFDCSTFAYQIRAQGHGDLAHLFWEMRKEHLKYVSQPLYIYLDVDPLEGLRRIKGREESNHFDQRDVDFHSRVRDGYFEFFHSSARSAPLDIWQKDANFEYHIINANRAIEEVVADTVDIVLQAVSVPEPVP
jgi:dTMP kinase